MNWSKVSGDSREWTNEIKEIKFKEVEQQVINHQDPGKRSYSEMNGENVLVETRASPEITASIVGQPESSPGNCSSK